MPVDVIDLVGHSIVGFTVDRFNVSLYLDNNIVIEPLEFSDAEFACTEDFARFLEKVGRKWNKSNRNLRRYFGWWKRC